MCSGTVIAGGGGGRRQSLLYLSMNIHMAKWMFSVHGCVAYTDLCKHHVHMHCHMFIWRYKNIIAVVHNI